MKNLILSMLALAALAGCTKSDPATPEVSDAPVPIRLNSGIELSTKAPVTASATVAIGGWEKNGAVAYTVAPTWQSTATVAVNASAAGITLDPVRYYNADNNIKSYIKGWYPAGTLSAGKVTFTNTDGSVDALLAAEISGSKNTVVNSALAFKHKTAQLVFKVEKGTGLESGTKIKSITVKNTALPTGFDLSKTPTDAGAVTWTAATALSVPNVTLAEIPTTAAVAGNPVMVQPVANNTTLKLKVETLVGGNTVTFDDVTFTTDGSKIEEGKSYTITLTFTQAEIKPKANITPWTDAAGSGTVL